MVDKPTERVIDFSALERELQTTLESDRRYQRENETKLRAINQNLASYKEFRDLVLTCHLRPVEPKDRAIKKQPWNPVPSGSKRISTNDLSPSPSPPILHLSPVFLG
uniref:Dynein attachment factor N-terminal domain-containing protein n=1 Tax=Cynoglossus semilaevis TaxID=244447 RepID=A0A3P8WJ61_CYNSE